MNRAILGAAALLSLAACGPFVGPLARTTENGEVLRPQADEVVERARAEGEAERRRLADQRAAAAGTALATCAGAVCDAVTRGEVALGMTEAQVLAATRTSAAAWDTRQSGGVTLMTARTGMAAPADVLAPLSFVSLQNGRVASYTYREPQGFRTVSSPHDATAAGRAAARAAALLREGDEYVTAGRLDLALERFDQADILRPNDPEITLRIARTLDKQLRPIEAVLRYRLFIHQLELERLRAEGEVAARIAEAIARAHERIVVLEKR